MVLFDKNKIFTRHLVDPVDLRNAPDYTLVYGVDIDDENNLRM